jgi:hypothetical protein
MMNDELSQVNAVPVKAATFSCCCSCLDQELTVFQPANGCVGSSCQLKTSYYVSILTKITPNGSAQTQFSPGTLIAIRAADWTASSSALDDLATNINQCSE